MFFKQIKNLNNEEFIRTTGINRKAFAKAVEILRETEQKQKFYGGRRNRYSIEDRLTMTLKYWKEYPTFYQMSQIYDMSNSSCYRNVVWVENSLIDHPDFQLPDKNKLLEKELENQTLAIDATDIDIERPKKTQ